MVENLLITLLGILGGFLAGNQSSRHEKRLDRKAAEELLKKLPDELKQKLKSLTMKYTNLSLGDFDNAHRFLVDQLTAQRLLNLSMQPLSFNELKNKLELFINTKSDLLSDQSAQDSLFYDLIKVLIELISTQPQLFERTTLTSLFNIETSLCQYNDKLIERLDRIEDQTKNINESFEQKGIIDKINWQDDSSENYKFYLNDILKIETPNFIWTKLFIELFAIPKKSKRKLPEIDDIYLKLKEKHVQKETLDEKRNILDLIRSNKKVICVGDGGSGKSTILCKIALTYAENIINGVNKCKIPIYLELSSYKRGQKLEILLRKDIPQRTFSRDLKAGKYIILLDGLNEIDSDFFDDAISFLKTFIQTNPKNDFVITTRETTNDMFMEIGFKCYEIENLTEEQIIGYLSDPFFLKDISTSKKVYNCLDRNIKKMISNPLILMMFASSLGKSKNNLSKNVPEIIKRFENSICNKFDKITRDELLPEIAFYMTQKNVESIYIAELEEYLTQLITTIKSSSNYFNKYLNIDKLITEQIINDLLKYRIITGSDKVKFFHQVIREYYTAVFLSKNKDINQILGLVNTSNEYKRKLARRQNNFYYPILLCSGLLKDYDVLIKRIWKKDKGFAVKCMNYSVPQIETINYILKEINKLSRNENSLLRKESKLLISKIMLKEADSLKVDITIRQLFDSDSDISHYAAYSIHKVIKADYAVKGITALLETIVNPNTDANTLEDAIDSAKKIIESYSKELRVKLDIETFCAFMERKESWMPKQVAGIHSMLVKAILGYEKKCIPGSTVFELAIKLFGKKEVMHYIIDSNKYEQLILFIDLKKDKEISENIFDFVNQVLCDLFKLNFFRENIILSKALLKLYPNDIHILYNCALSLQILGEINDSAEYYEIILKKDPKNKFTLFNYAELSIIDENYVKATLILEKIFNAYKDDTEALLVYYYIKTILNLISHEIGSEIIKNILSHIEKTKNNNRKKTSIKWYNFKSLPCDLKAIINEEKMIFITALEKTIKA